MSDLVLDVVIPVYNEQHTLAAAVRRVREQLEATFPYPYRITIADNASTDTTPGVAAHLAEAYPEVRSVRIDRKGRGLALRQVWSASQALILAYMDVDLSTDLDALWPLLAPLMSGHSDLAIGTRLHRDSRVVRGPKREFVSRTYNLILRASLAASFSDAQCGFKAVRGDVAAELLPLVRDDSWFFDTELLVLAQRCGLRIHEVPVDWFDDPDSRVDITSTAKDDLRGVWRLHRTLDDLPLADIRTRMGRTTPAAGVGAQTVRFGLVGAFTTVLHLGLFAAFDAGVGVLSAQSANAVALSLATVVNTGVNRRWTFGVRQRRGAMKNQVQGFAVFGLTWALTALALVLLGAAWPAAPTFAQTLVVGVGTVTSTALKFVLMRSWMFAGPREPLAPATAARFQPARAPQGDTVRGMETISRGPRGA